jgi:hypothetical protein
MESHYSTPLINSCCFATCPPITCLFWYSIPSYVKFPVLIIGLISDIYYSGTRLERHLKGPENNVQKFLNKTLNYLGGYFESYGKISNLDPLHDVPDGLIAADIAMTVKYWMFFS